MNEEQVVLSLLTSATPMYPAPLSVFASSANLLISILRGWFPRGRAGEIAKTRLNYDVTKSSQLVPYTGAFTSALIKFTVWMKVRKARACK
jgi:hypothetical protein